MTLLALPAIGLYCAASWRLGRDETMARDADAIQRIGLLLGVLALLGHAVVHIVAWRASGGADLSFFAALSLVAFAMAALSTSVAWTRRFDALGRVVYPLAAVALAGYAIAGMHPASDRSWQLQLHALLALLAYATLALAAVLAVMLWVQDRALRRRRLDHPVLRLLPPLTELEDLLFRTIAAGFLLLTGALLTGVVFVEDLFEQHLVHKTVLSALSWIVFGALLFGRFRYGWRGRRAVRLTLLAMGLLLLAYFGSKFVLELLLGRTQG